MTPTLFNHGPAAPFLAGGGEMGRLIRAHDWAATAVGPPSAWPAGLRAAVQTLLSTRHPVFVFWGPEHVCLYNDAYSRSLRADKHPSMLGRPARQVWAEIWPVIGPQIEQVMGGGEATWHEDQRVPILRNGALEEAYWTYSYGPIGDDAAPHGVGGVLVLCNETTAQVQAQQATQEAQARWRSLFEQAPGFVCILHGPEHRFEFANPGYQRLTGGRPLLGLTVAHAFPEAVEQGFIGHLDAVFRSGKAYTAAARPIVLRSGDGADQQVHLDFVYQPILEAGRVTGIFVQGSDVSDRVRANAALVESEARWRALAENLPGGAVYVIDRELRYVMAAGEALGAAGITASDMVGRTVFDLVPDERAQAYAAEYRQALMGQPFEVERQDRGFTYLTRGVPLRDDTLKVTGVLVAAYDITSRRKVEEDLRRARAQLEGVLSAADIGVWSWQVNEGLIHHDLNLARLHGLSDTISSTPQQHFDRIHPDDHAAVQEAVDSALQSGQLYLREYRIVDAQGGVRWLGIRGRLQRNAVGQAEVMNGLVIDISDLKKLEESLLASDRHKDRFLATLAHELRNPLAPLLTAAKLLQSELLDAAQLAWCADIFTRQVQHMAVLLDDLLDLSGVKYGRLRISRETVALQRVVDAAVETVLPLMQSRRQHLQVELPEAPLLLNADAGRITQVLSNLLTNAAKYTPAGGEVRLLARRIAAGAGTGTGAGMGAAMQQATEVEIAVHDTGIGLEPRDCERIFEMFSQVDSAGQPSAGGLGIGLALVKGFVELHGGRVRAHSDGLGRGSVFTVVLPALAASASAQQPGEAPQPHETASEKTPETPPVGSAGTPGKLPDTMLEKPQLIPRRVLIADDNTDAAESLSLLLQMAGHVTHTVADGLAAVAACAEFQPDVALLDIGMPGLNGYDVAKRLRADSSHAGMLLVALTGWGFDENRQQARQAGFDRYFTKPIDPDALLELLASGAPVRPAV